KSIGRLDRMALRFGIAAIGLLLFAAALFAMRTGWHPPAPAGTPGVLPLASQSPSKQNIQQAETKLPAIAVLDFANLQNDSQYAHLQLGIAEAFTSSFVKSKRFQVVERNQLEK